MGGGVGGGMGRSRSRSPEGGGSLPGVSPRGRLRSSVVVTGDEPTKATAASLLFRNAFRGMPGAAAEHEAVKRVGGSQVFSRIQRVEPGPGLAPEADFEPEEEAATKPKQRLSIFDRE